MAKMLWCKEGKHWARMALNPKNEFPPRFCEVCDTAEYQTVIVGGTKRHAKKEVPSPPNEVNGVLLQLIRRDRTKRKRLVPLEEFDKYD